MVYVSDLTWLISFGGSYVFFLLLKLSYIQSFVYTPKVDVFL